MPEALIGEIDTVDASCPACGARSISAIVSAPDRFHGRRDFYVLRRCSGCRLVWLSDPPAPEALAQHYGEDYDRWIAGAGDSPNRWKDRVDAIQRHRIGGSLLDIGCGSGGFLRAIASPAWKLSGIEMSAKAARRAVRETGADVYVGDILSASFPAAHFDVITCFHVFEHLYDPVGALKQVAHWLKPSGMFYLMVPNIDSAGFRIFGSYWYALELPRHLYHYSPLSLATMAANAGLKSAEVTTHREVFWEKSLRYCVDDLLHEVGIRRRSLAKSATPSVPFRLFRKGLRLTLWPLLDQFARLAGDGESIHAVFRRDE